MTGAQTMIYTAAVMLSTISIGSVIAGQVIPEPMIQGMSLSIIIGVAFTTWLVLILWIADSRHTAKVAEAKRRARAAEYTTLGQDRS